MTSRKTTGAKSRSNRGAAIIGGTAMLILLSALGIGMLLLVGNMATLANDYHQLQGLASETARQVAASRWSFGMERAEWKRSTAERIAAETLRAELAVIGYQLSGTPSFEYKLGTIPRRGTGNDIPAMFVECRMSVRPTMSLNSAKSFLFLCPSEVKGISVDSEQAVRRHAMALLLFIDPENPRIQRGIRVPIYNYTRLHYMSSRPNMIKAGRSVGYFPTGEFALNAPNQGFFQRDKTRRVGNNP